jgi:hypothetical protein
MANKIIEILRTSFTRLRKGISPHFMPRREIDSRTRHATLAQPDPGGHSDEQVNETRCRRRLPEGASATAPIRRGKSVFG